MTYDGFVMSFPSDLFLSWGCCYFEGENFLSTPFLSWPMHTQAVRNSDPTLSPSAPWNILCITNTGRQSHGRILWVFSMCMTG